jgi:subtilisin family serine protease
MPEHALLRLQRTFQREHPDASMEEWRMEMMKHTDVLQDFGRDWIDYITRTTSEGIRYLVDHRARVINISAFLGRDVVGQYPEFASRLDEAFAYAAEHDVVMVIGAGNHAAEVSGYPGEAESTIVVGASTLDDQRWEVTVEQLGTSFTQGSCFGPRLSVVAPSVDIVSAMPHEDAFYHLSDSPTGPSEGTYEGECHVHANGATSMATPVVTSLVALIRSVRPDLTAEDVVRIVHRSAVDIGEAGMDPHTGHGRVDFLAAVNLARDWSRH